MIDYIVYRQHASSRAPYYASPVAISLAAGSAMRRVQTSWLSWRLKPWKA